MVRARTTSLVALILIAGALIALAVVRAGRSFRGVPLAVAHAPEFALAAPNRGPVTLGDFAGDAVLLTFGRPSCGTACNPQLVTLKDAMERLGPRRRDVRVLFVTLEPDSLTEQELLAFIQDHDLGFTGLRGDSAAAQATADAYGAVLAAVPDSTLEFVSEEAGPGPTGQHVIYGIDRDGQLRVAWGPDDPAALARDVRSLLRF